MTRGLILMGLLVALGSGCDSDSSGTYTDSAGTSCEQKVAHRGGHWPGSGLGANTLWCPDTAAAAARRERAGSVPPPPLLVARRRGSTLQLSERPGAMVARFELPSCSKRGYWVAPDPRRIVVICRRAGASGARSDAVLDVLDARGTSTLAHIGADTLVSSPIWSSRSDTVSYADIPADLCGSQERGGPTSLWVADTDTHVHRIARLTTGHGISEAWAADWSPDGKTVLAVVRRYDGECRYQAHIGDTLLAVTTAGHAQELTDGQIGRALWSPRGNVVAVTRGMGDECALEVVSPSGRMPGTGRVVADFAYVPNGCFNDGLEVAWSPRGDELYFTNGPTLFRADAKDWTRTSVYRLPGQPSECNPSTPDCKSLRILDVSAGGHVIARVESFNSATSPLVMIDRNGRAHPVTEGAGESVIRFAEGG